MDAALSAYWVTKLKRMKESLGTPLGSPWGRGLVR